MFIFSSLFLHLFAFILRKSSIRETVPWGKVMIQIAKDRCKEIYHMDLNLCNYGSWLAVFVRLLFLHLDVRGWNPQGKQLGKTDGSKVEESRKNKPERTNTSWSPQYRLKPVSMSVLVVFNPDDIGVQQKLKTFIILLNRHSPGSGVREPEGCSK